MKVDLYEKILKVNDYLAEKNRELFAAENVTAIGLLGSPGAGKTALVERTVAELKNRGIRPAVLVGDLATTRDAERIEPYDIPCAQLTTDGACHLEAQQISQAVADFDLKNLDILIIENVGNLVCPSTYPLGEEFRAVVLSIPEGDDKIEKYPSTFIKTNGIIINKMDLYQPGAYDLEKARRDARTLNRDAAWFELSCATGEGIDAWVDFLLDLRR